MAAVVDIRALLQAQDTSSAEVGPPTANATSTAASMVVGSPAAAHKHAASEAYELEDLDEDWLALLNALDTRLMEVCLCGDMCLSFVRTVQSASIL